MTVGAHLLGEFKDQPGIKLPLEYFMSRDCWLDCRVPDMIHIDGAANIGWCVSFVSMTHDTAPGKFGSVSGRPIWIGANAFIGYGVQLYNCIIGEGAIVAVGSVVRSRIVPPWTKVEGNPARIFERFTDGKWVKANGELEMIHK
jgi:acetyltransferase-like isoleucine patch superfamily enzyme